MLSLPFLLFNFQHRSEGQESREITIEMKRSCSSIWSLNLPPKIRTFWWRIIHDGLPVAENLKRRNIKVDNSCQTCGECPETQNYMLFECRVTKEIWSLILTSFGKGRNVHTDTHENIKEMITLAKKDKREHLNFYIGWKIWKMRNSLRFQQKREHIFKVIHDALRDLGQWEEANNQSNQEDRQVERLYRHPHEERKAVPVDCQYYCHVDAS